MYSTVMAKKAIERKPLWERVYERLKRAIHRGELKPGERLVEQRLAKELGVSRTPIREALYRLEQDGLVEKIPHGGALVKDNTRDEVEEILGLRAVLEGYAAAQATKRKNEGLLRELEGILSRAEEALRKGNISRLIQLNTEFHDVLYRGSGNRKLYELITHLRDLFYKYRVFILGIEGMPQICLEDHREMLEVMRSGDARKVERMVREHINRGKEQLMQEIEKGRI